MPNTASAQLNGMTALMDDSTQTGLPIYGEAFNPAKSKRVRPCPQGASATSDLLTRCSVIADEILNRIDWPSILGSSYPIAHEHTNCASLLHMGTQVPPRTSELIKRMRILQSSSAFSFIASTGGRVDPLSSTPLDAMRVPHHFGQRQLAI